MEDERKRLIHGLFSQVQFCVNFIILCSQNGSFQTPKSCQFFEWFLFWSSHEMFMNLGQYLNDCYLNYKQKRWHFCKEFMVWHIVTKCTVVIVLKIWISSHFSNREIPAVLGIAPRKHQTCKYFGYEVKSSDVSQKIVNFFYSHQWIQQFEQMLDNI